MQVQKLKLDTEAAMLELDQILRANELTVAVVAAIPSLAIAGGTGYLLIRWITPSPPDRKSEALPARYTPFHCTQFARVAPLLNSRADLGQTPPKSHFWGLQLPGVTSQTV